MLALKIKVEMGNVTLRTRRMSSRRVKKSGLWAGRPEFDSLEKQVVFLCRGLQTDCGTYKTVGQATGLHSQRLRGRSMTQLSRLRTNGIYIKFSDTVDYLIISFFSYPHNIWGWNLVSRIRWMITNEGFREPDAGENMWMKWRENGELYKPKNSITFTLHKILLGCSS